MRTVPDSKAETPNSRSGLLRLHAVVATILLTCSCQAWAQAPVFPSQSVGFRSAPQNVSITARRAGQVSDVQVLTLGASGLDFAAVPASGNCASALLAAGAQCSQPVSFSPAFPGMRMGAVLLLDGDGNLLGSTLISGVGIGPLAVFTAGNILSVAGNGATSGSIFDGYAATSASLNVPSSVALDGAGNMFIADSGHNRIRKISSATGRISTLAGNGTAAYAGDGLVSTDSSLSLNAPGGVAVDGAGNVYIADTGNNRVRTIAASTGIVTTVAGNGNAGDSNGAQVGDGGLATAANLNRPQGVTIHADGDLFIADTANHRIRKVDAVTGIISTVAGNGTTNPATGAGGALGDGGPAAAAQLNFPFAVALDPAGSMYIPDSANNSVRLVNRSGEITTFAGTGQASDGGDGGMAASASLSSPSGVAIDAAGNVYIADTQNASIRKVSSATGIISTIARGGGEECLSGAGLPDPIVIRTPMGVALDGGGNLYFADAWSMRVQQIQSNNALLDFTATTVHEGSRSAPLTQTIENDGNAPLSFAAIAPGVNAAVDVPTTTCSAPASPLAVNADCQVGVMFVPAQGNSPLFGAVTVQANASNAPLGIQLVGNATQGNQTATILSSSLNPLGVGQAVTFTATVTTGSGTGSLNGNVTFFDGTMALGAAISVDTAGVAEVRSSTLVAGPHSVRAMYNGDANHPVSNEAVVLLNVLGATSVSLAASLNPSGLGQAIKFTATVSGTFGVPAPTGSLQFFDGAIPLGSPVPVTGSGEGTFQTSGLAVGLHFVSAAYSGDGNNQASTSATLTQAVLEGTNVALTSSLNPAGVGQTITFRAVVTSVDGGTATPDGTVTLTDGNATLATPALSAGGVASYSTTLANGSHSIVATYKGDASRQILGSISSLLTEQVLVSSQATIDASPNPSIVGSAVTFAVSVTSSGGHVPTGSVNILDGSLQIGTATLTASIGTGIFTISSLSVGSHFITASYAGDINNSASLSTPLTQVVNPNTNKTQPITGLTAAPNPVMAGAPVTLAATIKWVSGQATPTGTVTFTDTFNGSASMLGPAQLGAAAIGAINPTFTAGNHVLVATYGGDSTYAGSASAPLTLVVQPTATSIAVTSSADPSIAGATLTFSATVSGKSGAATGTVAFSADGALLGSASVNAQSAASLSVATLPVGSHGIAASYSGDALNAPSASLPIVQVIDIIPTTTTLSAGGGTLNATVAGSDGPAPTGTVTFLLGTSTLGTAPLSAAATAVLTPSLYGGTYTVVASYPGDPLHGPSMSQPLVFTEAASNFSLTVTPTLLTMGSNAGATAAVTLMADTNFSDSITLSCAGLPDGVTCQFSNQTVALSTGGAGSSQLTIITGSTVGDIGNAQPMHAQICGISLAGILMPASALFGLIIFRRNRRNSLFSASLLLFLLGCVGFAATGCTVVHYNPKGKAYTIQVIGTGANSHLLQSQDVTLEITP